jgi:integrase
MGNRLTVTGILLLRGIDGRRSKRRPLTDDEERAIAEVSRHLVTFTAPPARAPIIHVLLQEHALEALRSLPRPLDSTALVFPAPKGGYINLDNWRRRVWKVALASAGLDHRPLYQCRHTFATLALSAGADLYWVSKQLGHRDIRTTLKFYARFQPAVDIRNLDLLDAFDGASAADVSEMGHIVG